MVGTPYEHLLRVHVCVVGHGGILEVLCGALLVMGAIRGPLWRICMRTEMLGLAYEEPVGISMISGTL